MSTDWRKSSAWKGIYTPGDDFDPQITTNNVNGRYVITNSTLRYGVSDAIYMMGGQGIIQHNTFAGNGETGGEAVNVKAGCKVDAAYNLMFAPNTNGFKLSSSGQNDEAGRKQALIRAYNNTIVNAGWRRDGVKGGSVYVEKNALVSVFNNLMVNCKYKAQTPKWGNPAIDAGCATESVIDYNFYAAGTVSSDLPQDVEEGTLNSFLGYTLPNKNVFTDYIDLHSPVAASAGDEATNPLFVNFNLNAVALTAYVLNPAWDFHVAAVFVDERRGVQHYEAHAHALLVGAGLGVRVVASVPARGEVAHIRVAIRRAVKRPLEVGLVRADLVKYSRFPIPERKYAFEVLYARSSVRRPGAFSGSRTMC